MHTNTHTYTRYLDRSLQILLQILHFLLLFLSVVHKQTHSPSLWGYGPVYELAEHAQYVSEGIWNVKRPLITESVFAAEKTLWAPLGK